MKWFEGFCQDPEKDFKTSRNREKEFSVPFHLQEYH